MAALLAALEVGASLLGCGPSAALADAANSQQPVYAPFEVNGNLQAAEGGLTDADNNLVRMGFKDFDERRLESAEKEFSLALARWQELKRPRDEIVSLLKARANARLDGKRFPEAMEDLDKAIALMSDGEKEDGRGRYPEYADAIVNRGLAHEGLGDWSGALEDYDHAVRLWGGGRSDNVNPFVLAYRSNVLSKLGRFDEALLDSAAAGDLFLQLRDLDRFSDAKANYALNLYALDRRDEAVKAFKIVTAKNPGYADARVALAVDSWDRGDYIKALKQWDFVCNEISVGCDKYADREWVRVVRRWPENLVAKLEAFLDRKVSPELEAGSESGKRLKKL